VIVSVEKTELLIRWLIRRDHPEVLSIENRSFQIAWKEEDFLEHLRQRNCIGMVAEADSHVLGFVIYELHLSKMRILNFAVDPNHRRQGVGTQMVQRMIDKLSQQHRDRIELDIRESNLAAQLFFQSNRFFAERVIKSPYEDTDEDAYRMTYSIEE